MVCVRSVRVTPSTEAEERESAATHASVVDGQPAALAEIVREATRVERLAYTRTQAAAALGISRSTFNRRVLPLIETLEMPWGARLIPVDELQRLLAEQRRPARARAQPARPGRPAALAPEVAERIRGRARRRQESRPRSRASSTPPEHRQRTAAHNGGHRPCAASSANRNLSRVRAKPAGTPRSR